MSLIEITAGNIGLAKKRVQWLNEALYFVTNSVLRINMCCKVRPSQSPKTLAVISCNRLQQQKTIKNETTTQTCNYCFNS